MRPPEDRKRKVPRLTIHVLGKDRIYLDYNIFPEGTPHNEREFSLNDEMKIDLSKNFFPRKERYESGDFVFQYSFPDKHPDRILAEGEGMYFLDSDDQAPTDHWLNHDFQIYEPFAKLTEDLITVPMRLDPAVKHVARRRNNHFWR